MLTRPQRALATLMAAAAVAGVMATGGRAATAATPAPDRLRALNVVPPGESGFVSTAAFLQATAGVSSSYGPHIGDQIPLFAAFQYKPFQFEPGLAGTPVPGDPGASLARDGYGVPVIAADNEDDLFHAIGYAMAQDRLFQMEVFRRVGHGTLSGLLGPATFAMDETVRRESEGPSGRATELAAQPAAVRSRLAAFTAGVNQVIGADSVDPTAMPAEFALLADLPIQPWTDDDTLAFGEYAGRFFGEFGGTQLLAARLYSDLVAARGAAGAEAVFDDLFPLQDPSAPASIPAADGLFPRHTGPAVATGVVTSAYANHDAAITGPNIMAAEGVVDGHAAQVALLQRLVGIPLLGSNEAIVSGTRTADHNPMLYGGPQTGFSVPGYFWEAELHDPVRDERGVMVPGIPLLVIGRNADAAWTVTSGLDDNSDVFVEQLDVTNTTYMHNGATLAVDSHQETIPCRVPPTAATGLLSGLRSGMPGLPALCPVGGHTITVEHTVHGGALLDPTADHKLLVKQSAVDRSILASFAAWDAAGNQHTAATFVASLEPMALCFNFAYVDTLGEIAYAHVGKLPIRPANVDPNLPVPGTGAYDWQGYEAFAGMPHDINPSTGYLVNWNNKPAVGWWSPSTSQESHAANVWSTEHQVVRLAQEVTASAPFTLASFSQVARAPAYVDNPARILRPLVLGAIAGSTDPTIATVRSLLAAWDLRRLDRGDGMYPTAAVVIFDVLMDHLLIDVVGHQTGTADARLLAGCTAATCHLVSVDNLDAPTMKWELNSDHLVLNALTGRTRTDWFAGGGGAAALRTAVAEAVAELSAAQGANPAAWNEPVERAVFSGIGAASVPDVVPLPNRGSYGQVVEALVGAAPLTNGASTAGQAGLSNTARATPAGAGPAAAAAAAVLFGVARRRRRGAMRIRP